MNNKIKRCKVCGSTKNVCKYLCGKHYAQINKYGKLLDTSSMTKYSPNEIIIKEDYAILLTYDIRYNINGEYIVDKDSINLIKNIRWRKDSKGYAINNINHRHTIYLHKLIMHCPDNKFIDHIDKNKFNNRKDNLRIVDFINNTMNVGIKRNNRSWVKGVSKSSENTWRSRIGANRKELSYVFKTFDEAVIKRLHLESIHFKEFSPNYSPTSNLLELKYISKDDNKNTFVKFDLNGNLINYKKENLYAST